MLKGHCYCNYCLFIIVNWLQHVTRLNKSRMPDIMLNYRPNRRRRLGILLKRILEEAQTGLIRPSSWRMMIMMMIIIINMLSLVTYLFSLILLPLNQRRSPSLRLQVSSDCSTFPIVCDVPSTVVFRSESVECFPGLASTFFLKPFVTIPVAPIITGMIVHFRFYIRCTSVYQLLYLSFFFPPPLAQHFCLLVYY